MLKAVNQVQQSKKLLICFSFVCVVAFYNKIYRKSPSLSIPLIAIVRRDTIYNRVPNFAEKSFRQKFQIECKYFVINDKF